MIKKLIKVMKNPRELAFNRLICGDFSLKAKYKVAKTVIKIIYYLLTNKAPRDIINEEDSYKMKKG